MAPGRQAILTALGRGDVVGARRLIAAHDGADGTFWARLRGREADLDRELPAPDPSPTRAAFSGRLALTTSPHLAYWHDRGEAVGDRVVFLERVVWTYDLLFAALGFDLTTPREKLVFVRLPRPLDYLQFLRAEGADSFRGTTGYFHPARRLVVTRPVPPFEADYLGLDARSVEVGTAAHEMVHLLVTVSGLEPRSGDFPQWLHEGLAMQFEPAPEGVWAGPSAVTPIRLADWNCVPKPQRRLSPLVREEGPQGGYQKARYAAAWAFVHFLWTDRPDVFIAFLDRLRVPGADSGLGTNRVEKALVESFGARLDVIEAEWLAFMTSLKPER